MKTSLDVLLKNIKTKKDFGDKFYPISSILILIIAEFFAAKMKIFKMYPLFIVILNGLLFGYQTSKLIIATMAKVFIIINN
jgi:hypothetical protein